jgi:hypothetical protein
MRITVDHPSRDELSHESWGFYVSDSWHGQEGIAVVLDRYTVSRRATVRDTLRAESEWSRWGTAGFGSVMKLSKPPQVPQWVRAIVVRKITDSIRFLSLTDASTHVQMPAESHTSHSA